MLERGGSALWVSIVRYLSALLEFRRRESWRGSVLKMRIS